MEDKRIKLRVQGLTNSQIQSGAYALVLAEEGLRRIPIIVGMFEAQSIAIALEGINPPRPLTHDLFIAYTKATGYQMREIFIHKFEDGVFYSEIVLTNGDNTIRIDSRTSDAIAIALRTDCNIYTTESIMRKCGIVLDESSNTENDNEPLPEELTIDDLQDITKLRKQLRTLKKREIEERIAKAVAKEDYEFAKIYKDELLRREEEGEEGED
ncbi:MAG: bifunctional nuclease family protein [Tannerella sp.]|jgi:bifunctional DNase/RNase|nr:bifunctional nuclease family protein [Tannerella sp.]